MSHTGKRVRLSISQKSELIENSMKSGFNRTQACTSNNVVLTIVPLESDVFFTYLLTYLGTYVISFQLQG